MLHHRTASLVMGGLGLLAFGAVLAAPAPNPLQPPPVSTQEEGDKGNATGHDPGSGGKAQPDGKSNEKLEQPKLIEQSYPLSGDEARQKSVKLLQQLTVDLVAMFNLYKEAHWNLNGPLYLVLHEYYQKQADFYREQADIFAERALHLGFSVDGRYSTVARTSSIPDFPAGYITDNESLRLLIERVTVLQKEVYRDIGETEKTDPTTSNKLQDLAYFVDKNLWQLRVHLQKPGGPGESLPWANTQEPGRNAGGPKGKDHAPGVR